MLRPGDKSSYRRAFQLANLSVELAQMSERLAGQAMAVADAAMQLAEPTDEPRRDSVASPGDPLDHSEYPPEHGDVAARRRAFGPG